MQSEDILVKLNLEQSKVVTCNKGPLMVMAGAGSGKTKTIISKIAYLVEVLKINPRRILGITFTTKAAKEMRERLQKLIGEPTGKQVELRTFNSFGLKLLQQEREALEQLFGYKREYDEAGKLVPLETIDQFKAFGTLKSLIAELIVKSGNGHRLGGELLLLDDSGWKPKTYRFNNLVKRYQNVISMANNTGLEPEAACPELFKDLLKEYSWLPSMKLVYDEYKHRLWQRNLLEFDDHAVLAKGLLSKDEELRQRWSARYDYVLVDEYQDTNLIQYDIVKLLMQPKTEKNICVVGDMDQSIYAFRGADIGNIAAFKEAFACEQLLMERNYRSTQGILALANNLIGYNKNREKKRLWTATETAVAPVFMAADLRKAPAEAGEDRALVALANQIAEKIKTLMAASKASSSSKETDSTDEAKPLAYKNIAVLYRTNRMGDYIKNAFEQAGIPLDMKAGEDIELDLATGEEKAAPPLKKDENGVKVMTVHSSKGLEFKVVFVFDLIKDKFPYEFPGLPCDMEEERRLCYVAVTRAEEQLYLCYDEDNPSCFIQEMKENPLGKEVEKKIRSLEQQLNLLLDFQNALQEMGKYLKQKQDIFQEVKTIKATGKCELIRAKALLMALENIEGQFNTKAAELKLIGTKLPQAKAVGETLAQELLALFAELASQVSRTPKKQVKLEDIVPQTSSDALLLKKAITTLNSLKANLNKLEQLQVATEQALQVAQATLQQPGFLKEITQLLNKLLKESPTKVYLGNDPKDPARRLIGKMRFYKDENNRNTMAKIVGFERQEKGTIDIIFQVGSARKINNWSKQKLLFELTK